MISSTSGLCNNSMPRATRGIKDAHSQKKEKITKAKNEDPRHVVTNNDTKHYRDNTRAASRFSKSNVFKKIRTHKCHRCRIQSNTKS